MIGSGSLRKTCAGDVAPCAQLREQNAGNAANAAALIGRIEASGHFADVQFSAPTTLAEGEGESFTITARVVPGRRLD